MRVEDYRVRLEMFDGPMDLLLFLIRRAEVDITDIPIADIAEQYVEFLRGIERIDIDVAGEFLLMAATLMEIKSRMLMPRPSAMDAEESAARDEADPRGELVRQLLAYKKNRDAAGLLEDRLAVWQQRWPTAKAGGPPLRGGAADESSLFTEGQSGGDEAASHDAPPQEIDIGDLELIDLVQAYSRVAAAVDFTRLGDHQVSYDDTPIEIHAEEFVARLAEGAIIVDEDGVSHRRMALAQAFMDRTRSEKIGVFLAVLELVRQGRVRVFQHSAEGPIVVELNEAVA